MSMSEMQAKGSGLGSDELLEGLLAGPDGYFAWLVKHLTERLGVDWAFLAEIDPTNVSRARSLAVSYKGELSEPFEYVLAGTPCENVVSQKLRCYPERVAVSFPKDELIVEMGLESYAGTPLWIKPGRPLGVLAAMHSAPMCDPGEVERTLELFAQRASMLLEQRRKQTELSTILAWSSGSSSEDFFVSLVRHVGAAFHASAVLVAEVADDEPTTLRTVALWMDGALRSTRVHPVVGSACEEVYRSGVPVDVSVGVTERFPEDTWLRELGASTYQALPILGAGGRVIGHVAVAWRRPNVVWSQPGTFLQAIVARAGSELERRRVDEALRASEKRYRALLDDVLDASNVGIVIMDRGGVAVWINQAMERFTGVRRAEVIGRPMLEALGEHVASKLSEPSLLEGWLARVRANERSVERFTLHLCPEGGCEERWLEHWSQPIRGGLFEGGLLLQYTDVTELTRAADRRVTMERRLLEAQKLESLGILTGGIAHDFNNLLVGIMGNASLALRRSEPGAHVERHLRAIEKASQRATDLVRQMLAYSGRGEFEITAIDLNDLILDMQDLLVASIPKRVSLKLHLAEGLSPVAGDITQMRQILMNLVINGAEAIDSHGVVSVSTGKVVADAVYVGETIPPEDLPEGEYVYFEVADTGHGMDESTSSRVFEPFFTTKFAGRGLGLAAARGIVRGHGGAIKLCTEPGQGSTFTVLLPPADTEPTDAELGEIESARGETLACGFSGTALLVDDQETVRESLAGVLEELGLDVVQSVDGRDGVARLRLEPTRFAVIFLDLAMPGMGGVEAYAEIRRIASEVPVVLMSGYSRAEATSRFTGEGLAGFLAKPFRIEDVEQILRHTLGGG
jgi:PAS domain S-box-containing protein